MTTPDFLNTAPGRVADALERIADVMEIEALARFGPAEAKVGPESPLQVVLRRILARHETAGEEGDET